MGTPHIIEPPEALSDEDRLLLENGVAGSAQGEKALRIIAELERDRDFWMGASMSSDELGSQWAERAGLAIGLLKRVTADDFDKSPVGEALWVEVREFLEKHGG